MKYEQVQLELSRLEGKEVSFRRLAGNTIILYFNGEPGDDDIISISIDPSWRYRKGNEWLLGSADIPWEKDDDETSEEFSIRFNNICNICLPLSGSIVENIILSSSSSDLEIKFSNSQRLVSFAGYTDEESWTYRNRPEKRNIYGSLKGYEIENT